MVAMKINMIMRFLFSIMCRIIKNKTDRGTRIFALIYTLLDHNKLV